MVKNDNIVKGKEWVKGLTQQQFDVEYMKRNPYADVIPDVNEWIIKEETEQRGVGYIQPEAHVIGD